MQGIVKLNSGLSERGNYEKLVLRSASQSSKRVDFIIGVYFTVRLLCAGQPANDTR
jgi:hypothetical protein